MGRRSEKAALAYNCFWLAEFDDAGPRETTICTATGEGEGDLQVEQFTIPLSKILFS